MPEARKGNSRVMYTIFGFYVTFTWCNTIKQSNPDFLNTHFPNECGSHPMVVASDICETKLETIV